MMLEALRGCPSGHKGLRPEGDTDMSKIVSLACATFAALAFIPTWFVGFSALQAGNQAGALVALVISAGLGLASVVCTIEAAK